MKTTTINISGMSCEHCVRAVTKTLKAVPGVEVRDVAVGKATVDIDPTRVKPHDLAAALSEAGYEAQVS